MTNQIDIFQKQLIAAKAQRVADDANYTFSKAQVDAQYAVRVQQVQDQIDNLTQRINDTAESAA